MSNSLEARCSHLARSAMAFVVVVVVASMLPVEHARAADGPARAPRTTVSSSKVSTSASSTAYPGIGRQATPKELAAWDIDVRPDFKGLPQGSGSVAQGQVIWDAKCASCHGVFGESNSTFHPLVGGTSLVDVKAGRAARLRDPAYPARSTIMKVPTLSTLWDYINRAMPWNQPKSLTTDEVYAVTAFMLHLADVVPSAYVLSHDTMGATQALMPNRHGMTTDHAMWPGASNRVAPDVRPVICMTQCGGEPRVTSILPDHARNAHGNLAEQNRLVGPQRGAATVTALGVSPTDSTSPAPASAVALLSKHACTACHGMRQTTVGPSFADIAARYGATSAQALMQKIKSGGVGVWGTIPMPAQNVPDADISAIAVWIADGAKP